MEKSYTIIAGCGRLGASIAGKLSEQKKDVMIIDRDKTAFRKLPAFPFLMYGDVTPVQALFESVSGFTTTGLSVLDVEKLPHTFLFYRAFLQYVGGLGFIMTMLLFV